MSEIPQWARDLTAAMNAGSANPEHWTTMSWPTRYHDGYSEARANVERMNLDQLLLYIDGLYGRDGLSYGDGVEDVRAEALSQCERDFTNPAWTREAFPFVAALRASRVP